MSTIRLLNKYELFDNKRLERLLIRDRIDHGLEQK